MSPMKPTARALNTIKMAAEINEVENGVMKTSSSIEKSCYLCDPTFKDKHRIDVLN
jgi:hypothetical protein